MSIFPSATIIIPTLNRKYVLEEALLSLNKVDYPRDLLKVVVVNDGSSDGTKELLKRIKNR